jgi:hypothetical protein
MKEPGVGGGVIVFGLIALAVYFLYTWAEESPSPRWDVAGVSYTPPPLPGVERVRFTGPEVPNRAGAEETTTAPSDKDSGSYKAINDAITSRTGAAIIAAALGLTVAILYAVFRPRTRATRSAAAASRSLPYVPASLPAPPHPQADPGRYAPADGRRIDSGAPRPASQQIRRA